MRCIRARSVPDPPTRRRGRLGAASFGKFILAGREKAGAQLRLLLLWMRSMRQSSRAAPEAYQTKSLTRGSEQEMGQPWPRDDNVLARA